MGPPARMFPRTCLSDSMRTPKIRASDPAFRLGSHLCIVGTQHKICRHFQNAQKTHIPLAGIQRCHS